MIFPTSCARAGSESSLPIPARTLAALVLASIALASCAPAEDEGAPDPFGAEPWEVVPELRIGAVDDPTYAFGYVGSMAIAPDGAIFSAHPQETEVRRWTPDGEADGRIGREGEGPGEFQRVSRTGFFGDTIWVWDSRQYRVSYFGPDGTFARSVSPKFEMGRVREGASTSHPRPSAPFPDGTFYGSEPSWSQAVALGDLTQVAHVHLDVDGTVLDTLYVQAQGKPDVLGLLRPNNQGGTFGPQPYGDGDLMSVDPDGEALFVLQRRAWGGEGSAELHVLKLSVTGDTIFRRSVEYEPRPLTDAEVDSALTARAVGMHSFMSRAEEGLTVAKLEERMREAMYVPDYHPPADDLVIGRDGTVWIRRTERGPDGREWWVLDRSGEPLARAVTPGGFGLSVADTDNLWGVERDELDVSYIVRYGVMKDPA